MQIGTAVIATMPTGREVAGVVCAKYWDDSWPDDVRPAGDRIPVRLSTGSQCAPTPDRVRVRVTVGEYRELIGAVAQWSTSVKSAANADERAGEVETLKRAVQELRASSALALKTHDLERAVAVLLEADRLIGGNHVS